MMQGDEVRASDGLSEVERGLEEVSGPARDLSVSKMSNYFLAFIKGTS